MCPKLGSTTSLLGTGSSAALLDSRSSEEPASMESTYGAKIAQDLRHAASRGDERAKPASFAVC